MKDELISRQAAIDAILAVTGNSSVLELYEHVQEHELSDMWSGGVNAAIDIIIALPSVQPEPCEDAVSREAVSEWLKQYGQDVLHGKYKFSLMYIWKNLMELPSAQPEPCEDCVSRKAVIRLLHSGYHSKSMIEEVKELPPVQPEPIRINLNEPIKVKLTDWGKEIYYHRYDRTNQIVGRKVCKPMFPKEDENGYTEFQLWYFIELYGEHMGITLPNVIEPLEIIYKR